MNDYHLDYGKCDVYGINNNCSECSGIISRRDGIILSKIGITWGDRTMVYHMPEYALVKIFKEKNVCHK